MKLAALSIGLVAIAALLGPVAGAPAPAKDTSGSSTSNSCATSITYQLLSYFTTDKAKGGGAMCESSDSGYTAGIAQFNTKDGSALKVVDKYKDGSNYQDEFEAVYAALEKAAKDKSASTDGLTDFCDAWTTAAGNGNAFYSAQVAVARSMLEKNAKQSTWTIGLKYPLSKSLMMLTAFSNGYGKDGSTLGGIIAAADKKFDADTPGDSGNTLKIGEYSVDEMEWVKAFLDAKDELSGDSSSKQSDVIRNIIKGGYYKFNQSFKVKGINGKSVSFTCGNPTTSN